MVNFIENIDKANKLMNKIGGEFIAVTMEIADTYLTDLMPELRKEKKIFRQEAKRLINHCRYNKEKTGLHDMTATNRKASPFPDVYTAYVDACNDAVKHDIFILQQSIQREMMRCNIPYYTLFSKIETMRILLILSSNAYKGILEDIRKTCTLGENFKGIFNHFKCYNISHITDEWTKVADIVFRIPYNDYKVDLNKPKDIRMAFNIIQNKYLNGRFLDQGALEAVKEFDFIKEKYNAENPDNPLP